MYPNRGNPNSSNRRPNTPQPSQPTEEDLNNAFLSSAFFRPPPPQFMQPPPYHQHQPPYHQSNPNYYIGTGSGSGQGEAFQSWQGHQQAMWGSQHGYQAGSPQTFGTQSSPNFYEEPQQEEDDPVDEELDDVDEVQETPEEDLPATSKGKGKEKAKRKHRLGGRPDPPTDGKKNPWTPEEQEALCRAWIAGSEHAVKSNYLKRSDHTATYVRLLHETLNKPEGWRTEHSVVSKMNRIKTDCQKFNAIWKRMNEAHKSGETKEDVINKALKEYASIYAKKFIFRTEWDILQHSAKFKAYCNDEDPTANFRRAPSSKRSKTASESEAQASQSSDARNEELGGECEGTPGESTVSRPKGRDTTKRDRRLGSSRSGGSNSSGSAYSVEMFGSMLEKLSTNVETLTTSFTGSAQSDKDKMKIMKRFTKSTKEQREAFLAKMDEQNQIALLNAQYQFVMNDGRHLSPDSRAEVRKIQQNLLKKFKDNQD